MQTKKWLGKVTNMCKQNICFFVVKYIYIYFCVIQNHSKSAPHLLNLTETKKRSGELTNVQKTRSLTYVFFVFFLVKSVRARYFKRAQGQIRN